MGYQEVVDVRRVEAAEQRDVQLDELIRNHDVRRVVAVRILRRRRDACEQACEPACDRARCAMRLGARGGCVAIRTLQRTKDERAALCGTRDWMDAGKPARCAR